MSPGSTLFRSKAEALTLIPECKTPFLVFHNTDILCLSILLAQKLVARSVFFSFLLIKKKNSLFSSGPGGDKGRKLIKFAWIFHIKED